MTVLLDTNALLRAAYAPGKLTAKAEEAFIEADRVLVSVVSLWEIGLKLSRGGFHGLKVPDDWNASLVAWMMEQRIETIGIEVADCRTIQVLPFHHKDPFDRMMIAQCLRLDCNVISTDDKFDLYGIRRVW
jgi:PIN domain nuclease of toxin-antitoxin system